jgi:carbon-monoxide dehydrogenase medium subunit
MLPPFELLQPSSLDEALKMLAAGESVPLAGGTNLLPDLRAHGKAGGRFISLAALDQLRGIEHSEHRVNMGGGTTLSDILGDPLMPTAAPALVSMAKVFAGTMVRNAATVAGNICYGSPSADVVPPLLSLDAEVTLVSAKGERTLGLDDFLLDYKKTACRPDELLTAVNWTPPATGAANLFYKLARRQGDAITVVGVAVTIVAEGHTCTRARIALSSVAPTVFRAQSAENILIGESLTAAKIDAAAQSAAEECRPIDDIRASGEYRRHAVHMLVRRLLTQAWQTASGANHDD